MMPTRFSLYLISFSVLFAACQGSFDDHDDLTVFRYNEDGNISSLDPVYARNQSNIWATSQI
ncbi:MAG: ABC transporter substrate-binding protein, partial [Bacteroidota bacterium]